MLEQLLVELGHFFLIIALALVLDPLHYRVLVRLEQIAEGFLVQSNEGRIGEAVHRGKQVNFDTIAQVDILLDVADAFVDQLGQLEEHCCVKQLDHILVADLNFCRVDEVQQTLHGPRRHVLDEYFAVPALLEVAREHRLKVLA
ncbi:hypothetical protein BpHYR1_031071 [Brachionus plicatilis]|uniref:Uncharacterized protein n=1 Tax=Brachionus plicatilis TaxID=10195 RepID=A0A3M7RXD2_BRAPC|nr:hypothetical protein BpHYR1_031071 [Brachionus plicatilis]